MVTHKVIQITKPHELKLATVERPVPGSGDVLIKVMASGICGTDIHILEGEYLGDYPVIPGHEIAGVVEQVGKSVTRIAAGDKVAVEPKIACDNCSYCLNNQQNFCENWQAIGVTLPGGMAEVVIAPEKAVFNIGKLEFEEGAFVEPLSCVLHGVSKARIGLADRVAVLGVGFIGLLLLQVVKLQGAQCVSMVELDAARAQAALDLGADQVYRALDDLPKDSFEVVIDAIGVIAVMKRTPEFARNGGKILLFSVPPKTNIELEAFTLFRKALTILTSYTSVWNSLQVIGLLKNKHLDIKRLISHRLPLADFEHGVDLIKNKREQVKKVIVTSNM